MSCRIQIKNATIVNEGRSFVGSVLIDHDRIDEILTSPDAVPELPADEVVDATGCYLLPGVIDEHVHFRDPGLTHKADFSTESLAAAAGGVTTILDMPNTLPPSVTREAVVEKLSIAAESCHVNFGCFIGATRTNIDQLRNIMPNLVAGIKLFMGSSTGEMEVEGDDAITAIFEQSRLPIVVHCEDNATIAANMKAHKAQYGDDPDIAHHPAIRSEEACYRSTAKAIELARLTGARLHVAHITTAAPPHLLRHGLSAIGQPHQVQPRHQDGGRPCRTTCRPHRWAHPLHRHRPRAPSPPRENRWCGPRHERDALCAVFPRLDARPGR